MNTPNNLLEICQKCNRITYCDFPCIDAFEDWKKYLIDNYGGSNGKGNNINEEPTNDNDIENFLEHSVESLEWLRVCNGQIPYTVLLDKNTFKQYFISENERYCDQEGICPECRNPLKEFVEMEDGIISERYWSCGNGC